MSLRDLPEDERPREKLLQNGAAALADSELIAIFLRIGVRGKSAVDLARALLDRFGSLGGIVGAELAERSHASIFSPKLLRTTVIVTIAYFFHIMTFYFILKWIPKIVVDMGFSAAYAGSVLVWNGSLWHGGGANRSGQRRVGIAMNYCAGFIRQQENQQLGIPRDIARGFPKRLRELVGYGIYRNLIGHIEKRSPDYLLGESGEIESVWDLKDRVDAETRRR